MNTAEKAQGADARLAFDNHSHALVRHITAVRELLVEAQLREFPDSVVIPVKDLFARWVQPAQLLGRTDEVLRTIALVALNDDAHGVFYEAGLKPDGTYKWRGCRYGFEPDQYYSGFGSGGDMAVSGATPGAKP